MEDLQDASNAELEIMRIIWQSGGEITVKVLLSKLCAAGKSWKSSTVVTFLSRLVEKGMLTAVKDGRNNRYAAAISEKELRERQTHSFLKKIYDGNAKELVAALLKHEKLTKDDIEELSVFWREGEMGE
ncbi:MAG: BlaI/MecI/CopY family transcriptional regulator [Oscillospiraceae bacterium]|nr:BlaI/MecI/CopY family transcriptional regulator [Oscillospiraceae bacterium]